MHSAGRVQSRVTITCADCGATQSIPPLTRRGIASCHRCGRVLARRLPGGVDIPLASAGARIALLPAAFFLPLFDATIANLLFEESRLVSSVTTIYREVWFPFAFGFLLFAFLLPAVRSTLQFLVLGSIRFGWRMWERGRLFRWSEELRAWSMTDVVVIAGVVAYYRASVSADVAVRVGAWCYVVVALLVLAGDLTLDRRAVWNAIFPDLHRDAPRGVVSCDQCELALPSGRPGEACPRCGEPLEHPAAPRFAPALGAVAAAVPLCLPAYAAAVMVSDSLTGVIEHTVFGTVQLLADRGYRLFGVVVLVAGIAVPMVVLAGMFWLLFRVRFPAKHGLVVRTRVYRVLHRLVRWPMIIPSIAALAAPIVDFRGFDDVAAGPGATPLFAVIALLMLAVRLFEPRLMWKTAGEPT